MQSDPQENPWETTKSEVVFKSPWISVTRNEVIHPAGTSGEYSTVHFKNVAIGIVPMDDDRNIWIVGQFRYPLNRYSWEIVEGGGPLDAPLLESAQRELLEETGIVAEKWEMIQETHLSNSVTDEYGVIFVARDLSFHKANPEDSEQLQVKKIPFEDFYRMVEQGEVTDSLSVIAAYKLKVLIQEKKV